MFRAQKDKSTFYVCGSETSKENGFLRLAELKSEGGRVAPYFFALHLISCLHIYWENMLVFNSVLGCNFLRGGFCAAPRCVFIISIS